MDGVSTATGLEAARAVLQRGVECRQVPGAVAHVWWRGQTVLHEAFGAAALEPERRPLAVDTVFDLASLTKPLATTAVILVLADRGELALDDPVGCYLPEMAAPEKGGVTVRRLLTHTSGLPGWRPTFTWGSGPRDILRGLAHLDLAYTPGAQVAYSCLGFILLGLLAESVAGQRLDELVTALVLTPLGLQDTGYGGRLAADRYAATERGNAFERQMLERAGVRFDGWRRDFYPGLVNDGNAYYGLGGISGNAGLFGTAADVSVLGRMWLGGGRYGSVRVLSAPAVALATSDQTPGLNASRGLGWQRARRLAPPPEELVIPSSNRAFFPAEWFDAPWAARSCGEYLGANAYGHTGFTGTSLWIDPDAEMVILLFTNDIHPSVPLHSGLNSLRARFHNAVAAGLPADPNEAL